MSTRITIKAGDDWHIYDEFIDDTVWLELQGHPFEARLGSVAVRLPPAVIDAIRAAPSAAFPHLREKEQPQ
jgi:hypothetical protein